MLNENRYENCRFIGNYEIVHYDCPDYQDGIITRVSDRPDNGTITAQMIDGEESCLHCERDLPRHYDNCPTRV